MQSHTALLFLGTKSTASSFRRFSCNKRVHNSAFIMGNIYKRFVHRSWTYNISPRTDGQISTRTKPSVSKRGTLISFQARHFLGFQMRHLIYHHIFQPRCRIETSQSTSRTRQQILVKLTIPIGCKLRHPLDKEWSLLVARNGQQ